MDFLLYCSNINRANEIKIEYELNGISLENGDCKLYLDKRAKSLFKQYSNDEKEFFIIGDFILNKEEAYQSVLDNFTVDKIRYIGGFFYLIIFNRINKNISIFNSLFSILPLYYQQTYNGFFISNRVDKISYVTGEREINKRFILENVLFNYQLFNESYIENIKLTPSNSFIKIINNKLYIKKHTNIEDFFPFSYNKKISIDWLVELFVQEVNKYLPDDFYQQALTGGFDGRTLTACGLYHKKDFGVYSFGNSKSLDTQIAQKLSSLANLPFSFINLNDEYVQEFSLNNGLEFIENAEGNASFSRAHYLFAAKKLASNSNYIITGNFGSEIFRALHVSGVVLSPNINSLFLSKNIDEAFSKLQNAFELRWLNMVNYKQEFESLREDFQSVSCFNPQYGDLSLNKKFYILVFEEIFRKYFGSEIKNQFYYLINRSPFLDFSFIKELFKSKYAGIHSEFFEHNPFKRFKGQVFYANVIKQTFPLFLNEKLDKGYYPNDILNITGRLNIAKGYLQKKINKYFQKSKDSMDSYSVYHSFLYNEKFWDNLHIDEELFRKNKIQLDLKDKTNLDSIFIVLSQIYWINKVRNWE